MSDELKEIELRLACLEEMVALLFASEHLLSADPKASLRRLETYLGASGDDEQTPGRAEVVRKIIGQVEELQERLPKKLVD